VYEIAPWARAKSSQVNAIASRRRRGWSLRWHRARRLQIAETIVTQAFHACMEIGVTHHERVSCHHDGASRHGAARREASSQRRKKICAKLFVRGPIVVMRGRDDANRGRRFVGVDRLDPSHTTKKTT
jgi:hypothetical protein